MPNAYDPALISPSELPIARRARFKSNELWSARSARTLCNILRHDPDPDRFGFTPDEWNSIATVAKGGMWPIPDHPYTNEDWARDESFAAAPGQEVTSEIYEYMLNVMPPIRLPRCKRTEGFIAGFMMGEPTSTDMSTGKNLFSAFAKSGEHHYFIGLLPVHPAE